MQKEEIKQKSSLIFEGMTSINAVLNSKNGRKIKTVYIDREKKKSKQKEIAFLTAVAKEKGFRIEFTDGETVNAMALGTSHGGIVAECEEKAIPFLTENDIEKGGFYVYMEGMEDPYNFGYLLRSLYASGVNGVILSERNWMSASGVVCRSSAGASELLPVFRDDGETIRHFKEKGYTVLASGIRDSVSVFDEDFPYPILLIVGGEKRGISRNLLDSADKIVRIDYGRPFRGSLSSASAGTVLAFEIFRKNRKKSDIVEEKR